MTNPSGTLTKSSGTIVYCITDTVKAAIEDAVKYWLDIFLLISIHWCIAPYCEESVNKGLTFKSAAVFR